MAFELGSAHGAILIDPTGVEKGVSEAEAVLNRLSGLGPSIADSLSDGFNEAEVNLLKMAEKISAASEDTQVDLLKMAETATRAGDTIDMAAREGERALDKLADAGPQVGEQIKKGADTAETALKQVSDAGPGMADGIKRGADEAETAIKRVAHAGPTIADGIKSGVDKAEEHLGRLLNKATSIAADIGKKVALGLAAAGVAVGALAVTSVQTASEFESSMAIMSTAVDESAGSLEDLREAALAVGSDTSLVGVSASSAAEAMTGLYKAGLDTTEIFGDMEGYLEGTAELSGALRASIDLAAASELDMVQASELAAVTLATFGGELETAEERAEFVNAAMNNFVQTADASVAEVGDLAAALINVGPIAAGLGISLEETNAALGILSTRGIAGSEAGTALKSMLTHLMNDTPKVNEQLQGLGVSLYDMHGNMLPLPEILMQLEQALFGVGEKTIFVSDRTDEQNAQLEAASAEYARLQGIYDKAAQSLNDYAIGVKGAGLSDEARAKKIAEQEEIMANAQAAMEGYGNQIAELESIGGDTVTVMSQLTEEQRNQAMQTLFGTYGMNAANALLAEGTEGWEAMMAATGEAATIQDVAAARTDTLAGSVEALQGVWEAFQIKLGTAAIPVLRDLADVGGVLIEKYGPVLEGAFTKVSEAIGIIVDALRSGGLSELFTTFEDGSSAIGAVLETFGMDEEKADAWGQAINNVAIAIGNIIAAVQEGGLTEVFTTFEDGSSVIGEFLEALGVEEGKADQLAQMINDTAIAVGELTTKVGTFLQQHGMTLLKVLLGVGVALKALSIITTISGLISGLSTTIAGLTATFTAAAAVGGKVAGVIAVLGGPVTLTIAAIAGAVALLAAAWINDWGGIQEKTQAVLSWLQTTIMAVLQPVIDWWNTNWPSIQATLETVWGVIQTVIQTAIDLIRPSLEQLVLSAQAAFSTFSLALPELKALWASLVPVFELVWTLLQPILGLIGAGLVALVGIAVGVVNGISNAIGPFITGLRKVIESVIQIITGVVQTVSGFFQLLYGLATNNQEMMRDAFLKMKDGIVNILSGLLIGAANLMEGLVKTIFGFVSGLVEGVIKFFTNLYNELVGHSIIPDTINDIISWFAGLPQKAANALADLWNKVKAPFVNLWTDLQNWWNGVEWNKLPEKLIEKVKTGLNTFWTDIKEKFDNVWTEVTNFWNTLKDWAQLGRDVIEGIVGGLEEKGAEIASTIKGYAEDAWEEIKEFFGIKSPSTLMFGAGIDVIQGLIDGIISIASNIWDFIKTPFDTLWESLIGWWEDTEWSQLAQDLMTRLAESLGLWEALQGNFDDLYAAVLDWWEGSDWEALAAITTRRISERLQGFWNDISDRFGQLYVALFASWNGVDWQSLGRAIIDGVIAGVNAKEGELRARMRAIAIAARTEAEEELQISSPSRVFIEIGEQIVAGLIVGIKTGTGPLQAVISQQGAILRQYFEQVIADGQSVNQFLDQLPLELREPIRDIAELMLNGSQTISSYFQTVIATGDDMNEWLEQLPVFLQPHVREIGRLIAEGNGEISNYFNHVIRTGEAANDFLELVPEAVRPMVEGLGGLIADGSGAIRSYFDAVLETGNYMNEWLQQLPEEIQPAMVSLGRMMSDATATVEELLSTAGRLGGIAGGVAGIFQDTVLGPMADRLSDINDELGDLDEHLHDINTGGFDLPEKFAEWSAAMQLQVIRSRIQFMENTSSRLTSDQQRALEQLRKMVVPLEQMAAQENELLEVTNKLPSAFNMLYQIIRQSPNEQERKFLKIFDGIHELSRAEQLTRIRALAHNIRFLSPAAVEASAPLISLLESAVALENQMAYQTGPAVDKFINILNGINARQLVHLPENFTQLTLNQQLQVLRQLREQLNATSVDSTHLLSSDRLEAVNTLGQMISLLEERNRLEQEYAAEQQRILELQQAQQDMQFLQQQLDLLKLIKENGLDAEQILGGIELGLGADKAGIIDAMVKAMQEMIKAAEEELQIASPSKVFERIGKLVNRGLALGIGDTQPITRAMREVVSEMVLMGANGGPQTNTTYANRTANVFGGQHIYNYNGGGDPLEQLQPLLRPVR